MFYYLSVHIWLTRSLSPCHTCSSIFADGKMIPTGPTVLRKTMVKNGPGRGQHNYKLRLQHKFKNVDEIPKMWNWVWLCMVSSLGLPLYHRFFLVGSNKGPKPHKERGVLDVTSKRTWAQRCATGCPMWHCTLILVVGHLAFISCIY